MASEISTAIVQNIPSDPELLRAYEAGMAQVELPRRFVADVLRSLPCQSSPFLDALYERSASSIPTIAAELALSAETRFGEATLPIVPAVARPEPIAGLMRDNYPEALQFHASLDKINFALQRRSADYLSFLALGNTVNGFEYTAACQAYIGSSYIYPGYGSGVVHLSHMLVSSSMRGSLLGIRMFKELLVRAAEQDIHTVEMLTRENTAYRGFKAGGMLATVLEDHWGYHIEDRGLSDTTNSVERMYHIRIAKD